MSTKKIYCYTYDVLNKKTICQNTKMESIINKLFDDSNENITKLGDCNKVGIFPEEDNGNYYSLELLKNVNDVVIPDNYMFFRIGRKKEIQGALKRNQKTFRGEEILNKDEQKIYELEICTYVLIDLNDGIMLELSGQFAPSIRSLMNIINSFLYDHPKLNKVSIKYKNILTEKMVDSLKDGGVRLGKIGYTYNIPDVNVLKKLGLDLKQIKALEELEILNIDVIIKNRPRIPLTKSSEKIQYVVSAFSECVKDIKETVFFNGSTSNSGSKQYTFNKEEVTYSIDVTTHKKQDELYITLSLDEMAQQIFEKIKLRYEGNKDDIMEYIK
ncbi:hypothetical protein DP129_11015 [Clostridium tetani]|uniref:hypothetical protein n=1 Tax=Clostridium tetani TaxID=1513 RepID=UPI00100B4F65|nr:hypothetical protein [Clostridium tetani]RXI38741.1 hypothetical protein DP129_11015 [Clostridium tetani]